MPKVNQIAPALSAEAIVCPVDSQGQRVVKHSRTHKYLHFGNQEAYLLEQLDGRSDFETICQSFEHQFGEPLSCEELEEFIQLLKDERLLAGQEFSEGADSQAVWSLKELSQRMIAAARRQSIYHFRVALFNPDRLLNWLEPRTRWLFSRTTAVLAGVGFVLAFVLVWTNRDQLISQFSSQFGWRTLFLAWFTTIAVTICHEFGHGLACKRYGGEVREMGALWIFFTPCLFCNVSDAWLVPSRWKRLFVSLAGTYVDLLIWIVAVFVWRLAAEDSAINYMAWIIVSTCGLRVAFNVNPLLRLDGYYALSDLLDIPNLRKQARYRWMEYVRWILWGAARPAPVDKGRSLLIYGIASWVFTVGLLNLLFINVTGVLQSTLGVAGLIGGATIFIGMIKGYFKGSLGGEFKIMLRERKVRLLMWIGLVIGILLVPMHDRSGGTFRIRPAVRWEVRAPVDAFLREVSVDEGDYVTAGTVVARLEVPELSSLVRCKRAEIEEVEALLHKLQAGARQEELLEQREKVNRAIAWRDLAIADLRRAELSYQEQLATLDLRISKAQSDFEFRRAMYEQSQTLYAKGGLAGQQLLAEKSQLQVAEAELHQAEAAKRARVADGLMQYESELARREKELADTQAALALLEAGTHPEEIHAQQARLARLQEEYQHLLDKESKQLIVAPADGTITTPRLREKIGQFLPKGAELCFVENQEQLEAEIAIPEEYSRVLEPGQTVALKPRSLPFHRLDATVDRISPSAMGQTDPNGQAVDSQRTVTVYCHIENGEGVLRSGMTGFGRIYHQWRPLGWIGVVRAVQLVRTEFWL